MARSGHGSAKYGYTLVELLIATTLTLVMMGGVATVFGMIGTGISAARAGLEMAEALRSVANRLRADLEGLQAPRAFEGLLPAAPGRTQRDGYFEYTEGPMGPVVAPDRIAWDSDRGTGDSTVGDLDDILMFTTRSVGEPFVGRHAGIPIESPDAEVAWFVRGRTLYRRQLLVRPDVSVGGPAGFFAISDVSVRAEGPTLRANSLEDLVKPEFRFAHQSLHRYPGNPPTWSLGRPYHPHWCVDWTTGAIYPTPWSSLACGVLSPADRERQGLGLPTLGECSSQTTPWIAGGPLRIETAGLPNTAPLPLLTSTQPFDAWAEPHPWKEVSPRDGTVRIYHDPDLNPLATAARLGEDVILSNVLSFDVKAWDPGAPVLVAPTGATVLPEDKTYGELLSQYLVWRAANPNAPPPSAVPHPIGYGAYVDLNYMCLMGGPSGGDPVYSDHVNPAIMAPRPRFFGAGTAGSYLRGTEPYAKNWTNSTDWPAIPARRPSVYDTWSLHYESGREGLNGFDDNGDGVVDDPGEMQAPPPYFDPLRGIQIKIRVFEPDSRQIREVTIVHSFAQ